MYEESEDYIIFVVGGPNQRTDYHINMTEEFFYQLKGDMVLKTVVDGHFVDVPIPEVFLLFWLILICPNNTFAPRDQSFCFLPMFPTLLSGLLILLGS